MLFGNEERKHRVFDSRVVLLELIDELECLLLVDGALERLLDLIFELSVVTQILDILLDPLVFLEVKSNYKALEFLVDNFKEDLKLIVLDVLVLLLLAELVQVD